VNDDIPRDALDRILRLFDSFDELVFVETEDGAAGTNEIIIRFKPSDRLSMLVSTLRATNFERLVVEN